MPIIIIILIFCSITAYFGKAKNFAESAFQVKEDGRKRSKWQHLVTKVCKLWKSSFSMTASWLLFCTTASMFTFKAQKVMSNEHSEITLIKCRSASTSCGRANAIFGFYVNCTNVSDIMSPNDESSKSSSLSVCIWVQPSPLPEMVPHLSGDQRLQLHRGTYWKEFTKCCNYIEPLPWCSENTWLNPTLTLWHWKVFSELCALDAWQLMKHILTYRFCFTLKVHNILLFRKVQ